MNKKSWHILDTLSDDWESIKQIYPITDFDNSSVEEVVDELKILFESGLIQIMSDLNFDRTEIIQEYNNSNTSKYWFGLTEKGAFGWEHYSEEFSNEKIDWNEYYTMSYGNGSGFIEGLNKEICEDTLQNQIIDKGNKVIPESIKYSSIDEVKLKYYKIFKKGFRIDFKYIKE